MSVKSRFMWSAWDFRVLLGLACNNKKEDRKEVACALLELKDTQYLFENKSERKR